MADNNMFISELLCFATKKYGNHENNSTKAVIASFYSSNDIAAAKELIFKITDELHVDGLPRMVSRRNTDNKARLDVDDIFALMDALDEKRVLDKLPKFVAHDPAKLPPFRTSDLDVCLLALRVAALEEQLTNVVSKCVDQTFGSAGMGSSSKSDSVVNQSAAAAGQPPNTESLSADEPTRESSSTTNHPSWADLAKDFRDDDFEVVTPRRRRVPVNTTTGTKNADKEQPRRSLRGTKTTSSGDSGSMRVAAVPRRITAFVGRLNLDTTDDDLCELMTAAGMKEAKCKRLAPKEGQTFKTAAFVVSCSIVSEAEFYTESNWPIGCELRDWYFKTKS
jgi:hypothetical protein